MLNMRRGVGEHLIYMHKMRTGKKKAKKGNHPYCSLARAFKPFEDLSLKPLQMCTPTVISQIISSLEKLGTKLHG